MPLTKEELVKRAARREAKAFIFGLFIGSMLWLIVFWYMGVFGVK